MHAKMREIIMTYRLYVSVFQLLLILFDSKPCQWGSECLCIKPNKSGDILM